MNKQEAARELLDRRQCRANLLPFTKRMYKAVSGKEFIVNAHHELICNKLEEVYTGECRRLIINIPPRYSKTELIKQFISWSLGKSPDSHFIITSYSSSLALGTSYSVREIVSHEAYAGVFATRVKQDAGAKGDWKTTSNGQVYATGAEGTITGFGAGRTADYTSEGFGGACIIDDPHKPGEALSEVIRRGTCDWFNNTLVSRCNNPKETPIIVIMQRLHVEDLAGFLIDGGSGDQWEVLDLKAICEDKESDPLHREVGEALWPAKHSAEHLALMNATDPYTFAGQYQQRPIVMGGNIIKGDWFLQGVPIELEYRKVFIDTALKTGKHNDYTVIAEYGRGTDGKLYVMDVIRGKWQVPDQEAIVREAWARWSKRPSEMGYIRSLNVEDAASGTGLIQALQRGNPIPVEAITRRKDKLTRCYDVLSYISSGRVVLLSGSHWINDFIAEAEAFTPNDSHAHDDQLDTLFDAIQAMLVEDSEVELWARMS